MDGQENDDIVIDSSLKDRLEDLWNAHVDHLMRVSTLPHREERALMSIVERVREVGESGVYDLRRLLAPGRSSVHRLGVQAAQALAELGDGDSLGLVIHQAAVLWDRCVKDKTGMDRTINDFLAAARKLIPYALEKGPLHEGLIKALTIFTEHILDDGVYPSIFETAAVTGHPQLKEVLVRAAFQSRFQGRLEEGSQEDWKLRAAALFALRHYPDMQATLMEAMDHPQEIFARAAARAMIEMLDILKDCQERNFKMWKESAMGRVPSELKPQVGKKLGQKIKGELVYDRRQYFFWHECRFAHTRVMQGGYGYD